MTTYSIEKNASNGNSVVFAEGKNIGEFASSDAALAFVNKAQAAQTQNIPAANDNPPEPTTNQLLCSIAVSLHSTAQSLERLAHATIAQTKMVAAIHSDISQEEREEEIKEAFKHIKE